MRLVGRGIRDPGELATERVVLHADTAANLGSFLLLASREMPGGLFSSRVRTLMWLPDTHVLAGALVAVYTRVGDAETITSRRGVTIHRFYLGKAEPLWANPNTVAVLAELRDWLMIGRDE